MPVYTWTAPEGTFSEDQKRELAKIVTDVHCDATSTPRSWVRVIFNTYPQRSGFLGETPASVVFLLCWIRPGRSMETKQSMMKQLNDAAMKIGGVSSDALSVIVQEIAPGLGMEFGMILPEAGSEQEKQWLKAHEHETAGR